MILTNEDRAIRSLAVSPPSGWSWMESQESEVGVSGRGLCDLWPQKLMLTSASAASRSWCSTHGLGSMVLTCRPSIHPTWGWSGGQRSFWQSILTHFVNQRIRQTDQLTQIQLFTWWHRDTLHHSVELLFPVRTTCQSKTMFLKIVCSYWNISSSSWEIPRLSQALSSKFWVYTGVLFQLDRKPPKGGVQEHPDQMLNHLTWLFSMLRSSLFYSKLLPHL